VKLFAFLLAFLVLGLSCLPCVDEVFETNTCKIKTETIAQDNHNEKDHNDSCSPFCQCACCAGFSVNHSFPALNIPAIACCKNFVSYLPENIIEISLPVWEPPRI